MRKNKKKNKLKHIRAVKGGKYSIREKRQEEREKESRKNEN